MKRAVFLLAACAHAAPPPAPPPSPPADPNRITLAATATGHDLFAALAARSHGACSFVFGSAAPSHDFTIVAGDAKLAGEWTCDAKRVASAIRGRPVAVEEWLIDTDPDHAAVSVDAYGVVGGVRIGDPMGMVTGVGTSAHELLTRLAMTGSDLSVVAVPATSATASSPCDHAERAIADVMPVLRAAGPSFRRCVQGAHGIATIEAVIAADGGVSAKLRDTQLDDDASECLVAATRALAFGKADACPTPFTLPIVIP